MADAEEAQHVEQGGLPVDVKATGVHQGRIQLLAESGDMILPEHSKKQRTPLHIDMDAIRRAAKELHGDSSPKSFLEQNPTLQKLLEHTHDSYPDFIAALNRSGVPDYAPWMLELCRRALGDTCSTRTIVGAVPLCGHRFSDSRRLYGGRRACLKCGVGGDLNAHAVHTDGEMYVKGDIEAEAVYGYYNDHTLRASTICARLVIEDEHYTEADVEADVHFDLDTYQQGYGEGVQEQLREVLVDEVFT
ncbi:hypothetical protein BGZ61DRAFT_542662 [Ilyonectria robusta]|uniref:uncharacterized protein n=1 Tax=Ilyonectria robusta TaxID=1079257 RepID=UPI001E8D0CC7|nr:uncharacterized protein BGZ61DRAFT_542662 [Ilyonectria robusta]KAH8645942.1 hypothetical protein BGZ61DRAFT_542662 [Ilyonectria robusta]